MNKNQSSWPRVDSYNRISSWPTPLQPPTTQKWPARPNTNNEAEQLLREAVGYWDASLYRDGDRFLRNQGTAGDLLDLRLGSSITPNTNDPLYLAPESNGYAYLPGVSGNFLSVPDENALDITGDIDIRVQVAMDSWTPSTRVALISKRDNTNNSYEFNKEQSSSGLTLFLTSNTGVAVEATSSTGISFANNTIKWLRATWKANNGAGGNDFNFYTSDDGVTWVQLGVTQTVAGTPIINITTTPLWIGARGNNTNNISAKIYRAQVFNGIDGTTVLDIDCNDIESASQTNFSAKTGQVVSVNRSSSGRKTVLMPSLKNGGQPVFLFGTDDYMECLGNYQHQLLNFDTGDSGTVLAVVRLWADPQSTATVYKHASGNVGWSFGMGVNRDYETTWIYWAPTGLFVNGAPSYNGVYIAGQLETCAAIFDDNSKRINSYRGTTKNLNSGNIKIRSAKQEISAGLFNSRPMRVGANSATSPGNYAHMEFTATAIWRRPLTSSELALLNNYFQNRRTFTYTVPTDTEQKNFLAAKLGVSSSASVLDILKDAPFYIDSRNFRDGSSHVQNLGWRRDGLNIRLGSSIGSDSNDPKYLSPESSGYVYLPGVNNNVLTVPDENTLDIVGDLDLRFLASYDSYPQPSNTEVIGKLFGAASGGYHLIAQGVLILEWVENATTIRTATSTLSAPITAGVPTWIRATLDVDNGAGQYEVKFFTSLNGFTWTQLGTTVTGTTGTTTILAGTQNLVLGGRATNLDRTMTGKLYKAQILNGIDGPIVLDIDCNVITSASASSFTALTGQTVSINRSTSGRKSAIIPSTTNGGRPMWLFGTDDYMEMEGDIQHSLLNFTSGDSFTVILYGARFGSSANNYFIAKNNGDWGTGFIISSQAATNSFLAGLGDSQNNTLSTNTSGVNWSGSYQLIGLRLDKQLQSFQTFAGATRSSSFNASSIGNITPSRQLGIGRSFGSFSNASDFELRSVAIFRRALSDAEISTLTTFFTS